MTVQYVEFYELQNRGAVDPNPPSSVEGTLLVGIRAALKFTDNQSSYGEDYISIFPAFHNGERCWLMRADWSPAYGYSASGTDESIISFEDGVKVFLEREVFAFPERISTLEDLRDRLNSLPDGTTFDILTSDLEAGNFDVAHVVLPSGAETNIIYTGPIQAGYRSPHLIED